MKLGVLMTKCSHACHIVMYVLCLLCSQLTTLELQYVSPNLMECQDLELAVPGTYEPNQDIIHIKKVSSSLTVITSKQRPRKLVIQGHYFSLISHYVVMSWLHLDSCSFS